MGWIAYVGPILFPWGQAASRRVYGNARSLVDAGYRVVVASGSRGPEENTKLDIDNVEGELYHVGLNICPKQGVSEMKKALQILLSSSSRLIRWLDEQPTKPTHVILYGGYSSYMLHLLPWCRRNRVALVADVVEWYDSSHLRGGVFGLSNINVTLAMRYLFHKCDGLISISTLLTKYYSDYGSLVVQIPPTLDVCTMVQPKPYLNKSKKRLTLIYSGEPGNKDLLINIIRAMANVDPFGNQIRLLILGPTKNELSAVCRDATLSPAIEPMGKIAQQDVAEILQQADFSVFLRQPLRFANAGFPTKFVESLANWTPVIANLTSDLGLYLHDAVEGIVSSDCSVEAFANALRRAMLLTPTEIWQMRLAAHRQAEKSFDYRIYSEALSGFIEKIRKH